VTTKFDKEGSNPDYSLQPFCLEQPSKQSLLPISYKGPLILLIIFLLVFIPLVPGEDVNHEMFNDVRSRIYYVRALVHTADEGFALAGGVYLFGAGSLVPEKPFVSDIWLMKTDANGVTQWIQTYGGADCEDPSTLIQTVDGGFALASSTESFGAGGWDVWLVRTDTKGITLWDQTYGGADDECDSSLIQTVDGGFALVGWYNRFGTGGDNMWLVKTKANGVTQWDQTYGRIDSYGTTALVQTVDGGFALASSTESFGAGGVDMWLVKTDANGSVEWNQTYGRANRDGATTLVQTVDGGFALAGYANVSFTNNSDFGYSFSVMWLVKTDVNGSVEWNQTYGGVQTADGGFALAGTTHSYGAGGGDMWLVKTDVNGNIEWNQTYGGADCEWNTALVQTADGGFALACRTSSFGADDWDSVLLVKTDASGVALWTHTYGGADLEAMIATGRGIPGLGALPLLAALIVLTSSEKIRRERTRKPGN
jgi:predicted secreted protein